MTNEQATAIIEECPIDLDIKKKENIFEDPSVLSRMRPCSHIESVREEEINR